MKKNSLTLKPLFSAEHVWNEIFRTSSWYFVVFNIPILASTEVLVTSIAVTSQGGLFVNVLQVTLEISVKSKIQNRAQIIGQVALNLFPVIICWKTRPGNLTGFTVTLTPRRALRGLWLNLFQWAMKPCYWLFPLLLIIHWMKRK